ncbi:HutD family protein [Mesorhizobium sp. CGMCC 1.15528]|uniref:HutD family protein n=1 Tax=Mesorhizobium zhangyense TaxID=1776730 RepID=A0A7C9V7A1_9HYPH|nr:HutD family protein [Mesorhizobium zhangyense]NGN42605.1 HutD family protein [Mesorhizobium zhangyense]
MRVIRASEHRRMPWKNGGGETTEIAISPAGATTGDFDWRLSMARVESGGPFSMFPGIDRTLAVLDGDGLLLTIEGMEPAALTSRSEPLAFPGDAPTSAELIGGAVTDLNIMTRRGKLAHSMRRLRVAAGSTALSTDGSEVLLFCHEGQARIVTGSKSADLGALDTLHLTETPGHLLIEADDAVLFVISLKRTA